MGDFDVHDSDRSAHFMAVFVLNENANGTQRRSIFNYISLHTNRSTKKFHSDVVQLSTLLSGVLQYITQYYLLVSIETNLIIVSFVHMMDYYL